MSNLLSQNDRSLSREGAGDEAVGNETNFAKVSLRREVEDMRREENLIEQKSQEIEVSIYLTLGD